MLHDNPSQVYSNITLTHTVITRSYRSTIGAQLLHKMGWKEGQGIGPRVARKVDTENDGGLLFNGRNYFLLLFLLAIKNTNPAFCTFTIPYIQW